jgi:hypothetical protein
MRLPSALAQFGDLGVPVFKRTDGNITKILDLIVGTGIDGLHPIDPMAGMDLGEVKQRHRDRICLMGNIDCGATLSWKSVEEVRTEVREAIRKAGRGGGYICMSSNSIHSGVRPENCAAMVAAIREFGEYPSRSGWGQFRPSLQARSGQGIALRSRGRAIREPRHHIRRYGNEWIDRGAGPVSRPYPEDLGQAVAPRQRNVDDVPEVGVHHRPRHQRDSHPLSHQPPDRQPVAQLVPDTRTESRVDAKRRNDVVVIGRNRPGEQHERLRCEASQIDRQGSLWHLGGRSERLAHEAL